MSLTAALGYVIVYVNDVNLTLSFYEQAFGLSRRFFHEEGVNAYGELETGATRLAFATLSLAREHLKQDVVTSAPDKAPIGFEIALVIDDPRALFDRAISAGAIPVSEPAQKPWGQTVAWVRDLNGNLVELCTAMP